MNKKKLLIAGGGHADIPLILAAQKIGFYVITSGNREEDMGHQYSDEYCKADFSDKERMLELAKDLGIDAICPCCNDFSALSCAYVAEQMGFLGHDSLSTAEVLHHKDNYRKFAMDNNVLSPKAESFCSSEAAKEAITRFNFPVIVKPVDLTGGKGISKINSITETNNLIDNAFTQSKAKRVVIEEFIEGTNHGLSTFIRNGKIVFYFTDNEHYFLNKYMVSGASTPGDIQEETIQILINESEKIASLLKLSDGIFHIQFILRDKTPYIIEICRRPPGDLYIDFVKYATGVDYPSYIVKAFAGLPIDDLSHVNPKGYFTRHCVMTDRTGKVKDIIFDESIKKNVINKFMWWEKGDEITDIMTQKFGIVFLKYDSKKEMEKTQELNQLINVVVE